MSHELLCRCPRCCRDWRDWVRDDLPDEPNECDPPSDEARDAD